MFYNDSIGTYKTAEQINSAMMRVYNHMCLAVCTSAAVAGLTASSTALMAVLFGTALKWVIIFAPLVAIFAFAWAADRLDRTGLILFLHGFAALMGLSMSTIFVVFTMGSIFSAFMGAAILFAVLSGYGYFTKRSLDGLGQFMFIGLIAIVIASVINIFIGSTVMATVISALAIIIFLGLTAYDTQKIREIISVGGDTGREEVIGALTLYLDFINLFMNLLQLIGVKRD